MAQVALAGGLLAILVFLVGPAELGRVLRRANYWWVALVIVPALLAQWLRAVRWRYLLEPLGHFRTSRLFAVILVSLALSSVLPLRAGDIFRIQWFGARGVARSSVLATLATERLLDGLVFAAFLLIFAGLRVDASLLPLVLIVAAAFGLGLAAALRLADSGGAAFGWLRILPGRWEEPARRQLHAFVAGLRTLRNPRLFSLALGSSAAAWAVELGVYVLAGRTIGLTIGFGNYLGILAVANLALALPLTQAGIGTFELSVAGLMTAIGISRSDAAAYALTLHLLLTAPFIVAGLIAAMVMGTSQRDIAGSAALAGSGKEATPPSSPVEGILRPDADEERDEEQEWPAAAVNSDAEKSDRGHDQQ